jgi:glycosyl transferase family 25
MEHIQHAVYINLDRRTDRRAEFESECQRMGFHVDRFPAVAEQPGFLGCHKSHLAVLRMARDNDWDHVLIFEDDFQFLVSPTEFQSLLSEFFSSGIEYDVVMLSYNIQRQEPHNALLGKVLEAQTASGYLVHKRFYNTLIQNLEYHLPLLESTGAHWLHLNDQCWKSIQAEAKWYYFTTRIGKQRPSFSDLSNRFMDYNGV